MKRLYSTIVTVIILEIINTLQEDTMITITVCSVASKLNRRMPATFFLSLFSAKSRGEWLND